MSSDRRTFLQRLTVSGVAIGTLPGVLGAAEASAPAAASTERSWREIADELEMSAQQSSQPAQPTFDTSWPAKLTGAYKTVFDVPEINGGGGVWRAGLWGNHCRDVLKLDASQVSSVIVIRHAGIPLAMSHEFWELYDVAKESKVTHPMTGKKTRRNPVLMTAEEDQMPPTFAALALPKQIERGVIALACNTAFGGMVSLVAKKDKLPPAEARQKALTMLVPGVILQPNGIFGVALAQHHGCGFVAAS